MSADYGTGRFKAYGHRDPKGVPYLHVVMRDTGGRFEGEAPLGNLTLAEIAELALLAGQAWPAGPGVEVRYVIEARRPGKEQWQPMWSALADDDGDHGVSEHFAGEAYDGFAHSKLEWRLVRRTTVTADEILRSSEEPAP